MEVNTITAETHPLLFDAFIELDYDTGGVNAAEPEKTQIDIVGNEYLILLDAAERSLKKAELTEDELLTLVGGEETEMNELAVRKGLEVVHFLLNQYFNGRLEPEADYYGDDDDMSY